MTGKVLTKQWLIIHFMTGKVLTKQWLIRQQSEWESGCCLTSICQLYHGGSKLDDMMNADLFRVHLANDPRCICGCAFEDAIHFYIRMLSLQWSKRRIEIKTYFSSWTKNWSATFWRWHFKWDAKSTNFQICTTLHQTNKTFYPFMITTSPLPNIYLFN